MLDWLERWWNDGVALLATHGVVPLLSWLHVTRSAGDPREISGSLLIGAVRQLNCWSNDRDHYLDDLLETLVIAAVSFAIGVAPVEYSSLVLPVWDILFRTALYGEPLHPCGVDDPAIDGDNELGFLAQQTAGLRRFWNALPKPVPALLCAPARDRRVA